MIPGELGRRNEREPKSEPVFTIHAHGRRTNGREQEGGNSREEGVMQAEARILRRRMCHRAEEWADLYL